MSKEAVLELIKAVDRDAALKQKLEADLASADRPLNNFIATAAAAGYSFTGDEFIEAMDELKPIGQTAPLSDAELDGVVAGLSFGTTAGNLFRTYRAGPTAGKINPGAPVIEGEEEELMT